MTSHSDLHRRALLEALSLLADLVQHRPRHSHVPQLPPGSAIDRLAELLGLTEFERLVLIAAAGVEIDAPFASVLAKSGGEPHLSFGLLMALLPDCAHWTALTPERPLRRHRLIELSGGRTAVGAALRIDEHVLDHLLGLEGIDPRTPLERVPGNADHADEGLASFLGHVDLRSVVALSGPIEAGKRWVAASTLERLGSTLLAIDAGDLPSQPPERRELARLVSRELLLHRAALLIDAERDPAEEILRRAGSFADDVEGPVLIASRDPLRSARRPVLDHPVQRPCRREQRRLFAEILEVRADEPWLEETSAQFELGAGAIVEAARLARAQAGTTSLPGALWSACRSVSRRNLDDLAQRLEPRAKWADLVLPDPQLESLRDLVRHVRHRARVLDDWGFANRSQRGLGNSALFHGPSGTGKTTAAEVLARELDLDLYRIDLSAVVSKYIGETEKNLRRVFDAAESGAAILLFDEADALFGRRSERIDDQHDRYANLEVSYLLQRMESYRGLALLTTNMKGAMDEAFLRRIRFSVAFPFPGQAERERIWRAVFPEETPLGRLDYARLAQLSLAGGNIANIAMNAAFLAASEGESVEMQHVLRATKREYAKLERPVTPAEARGLL